jgi:hypothetical protein
MDHNERRGCLEKQYRTAHDHEYIESVQMTDPGQEEHVPDYRADADIGKAFQSDLAYGIGVQTEVSIRGIVGEKNILLPGIQGSQRMEQILHISSHARLLVEEHCTHADSHRSLSL